MSELHIVPESRTAISPADYRMARTEQPRSQDQLSDQSQRAVLLQRIAASITTLENSNPHSQYLSQLRGIQAAATKNTVDVNEAYVEWAKIVPGATLEIQELAYEQKGAKQPNPLSRLFKSVFG
jgi:hypothetical protein